MKYIHLKLFFLLLLPTAVFSQQVMYSEPIKGTNNTSNFNIIGKVGDNIIVFKNEQSKYAVNIYDNTMLLKEKTALDFMPASAFNVDYVAYPDCFYLVYQYDKKSIEHCMVAKLDADGQLLKGPTELDTTKIDFFDNDKIYSTVVSEDKQHILIFKTHRKDDLLNFATILVDSGFNLINKTRASISYDGDRDVYGNFLLDNDANFVFTKSIKAGNKDNISDIDVVTKSPSADTFAENPTTLNGHYADEVKLKIDNLNKRYIIHSFYYNKRNGDIAGYYINVLDAKNDSSFVKEFVPLNNETKAAANADVKPNAALDNFFIRDIVVKKDGGFIISAENYSRQSSNMDNPWNRWNYLYGNPFFSPFGNYYFSPFNSSFGSSSIRYCYNNILVSSFDNNGILQWNTVIKKSQYDDNEENALSYITFITGGEIHYLFDDPNHRDPSLDDNSITPSGEFKINPSLSAADKKYQFLPRYGKQVGARKMVIPCTYHNSLCFALIQY